MSVNKVIQSTNFYLPLIGILLLKSKDVRKHSTKPGRPKEVSALTEGEDPKVTSNSSMIISPITNGGVWDTWNIEDL